MRRDSFSIQNRLYTNFKFKLTNKDKRRNITLPD